MKNQKGITLVALIITTIIMVILSGIALIFLVGEEGILSQAQTSVSTIKNEKAKENVLLAWSACKNEYLVTDKKGEKSTYFTAEKLNANLSEGEVTEVNFEINENKESKIIYKLEEKYYKISVTSVETMNILEGPLDTEPTFTEIVNPVPPISEVYLVDKIEVGDYVDLGIDYENKQSFASNSYISATSALTGWRVLSKSGSGETGTVKLVSAGCPLTYYYTTKSASISIQELEDLNKELTIVTSGMGFRANGFTTNNLSTIFTSDKYIDISKGIHALGCSRNRNGGGDGSLATAYTILNEIEEAYEIITGTTMSTFTGSYNFGTTTLTNKADNNWKEKYTDLLANGQIYWLGGASWNPNYLWYMNGSGTTNNGSYMSCGIRTVVSLQAGVKLDSNNIGDGLSSSTAYSITK